MKKQTMPTLTEGEWKLETVPPGVATCAPYWITSNGRRLADIYMQAGETLFAAPCTTDNALAMAASKVMLSALIALADEFDQYDAAMTMIGHGHEDYGRQRANARLAIAKATEGGA